MRASFRFDGTGQAISARRPAAFSTQREAHTGDDAVPRARFPRGIIEIEAMHHAAPAFEIASAVESLAAHDAGDCEKATAHPAVVEVLEIGFEVAREILARGLPLLIG